VLQIAINPFGAKKFGWISGQDGLHVQIPVAFNARGKSGDTKYDINL